MLLRVELFPQIAHGKQSLSDLNGIEEYNGTIGSSPNGEINLLGKFVISFVDVNIDGILTRILRFIF